MSTTIDERIVSMKFDNKDFEKNVSTSLSTLDKLKQALSFKGASKGIEEVSQQMSGIRVDALNQAIDTINDRFSNLGIIGMTALQNIANQAINTGKQMIESLTIDPIKEGFGEYELKMGSVQNILNSARDAEGNKVDLDTVTAKLDELNEYADKTIYSFSDMTESIGKFTNAGVDLDKAVAAIQGISNEAALSGANANEASRAMYNFAQALSSGTVQLMDWKSIENANMATVDFKQELIDTAVAAGTLADNLDGTYTVLTQNNQGSTMDDVISATSHFNDSLAYQWMTADVLIETLGKYSDETTELGRSAIEAATEVKTFSQLMDTLKESVGSGWATTWEMIFGNYEESKQLWTDIYKVVGGFIDQQAKARNEMLKTWAEMNGRNAVIDGLRWAFEAFVNVATAVRDAFREFFPATTAEQLANISFKFRGFMYNLALVTEESEGLKNTFRGLFAVLKILYNALHTTFVMLSPLFDMISKAGWGIFNLIGAIGKRIADSQSTISILIDNAIVMVLFNTVKALQLLAGAIALVVSGIAKFVSTNILSKLSAALPDISDKLVSFSNAVTQIVTGLGPNLIKVFKSIGDILPDLSEVFANIGSAASKAIDSMPKDLPGMREYAENIGASVGAAFMSIPEHIPDIKEFILGLGPKIVEAFHAVIETISSGIQSIKDSLTGFDGVDTGSIDGFVSAVTVALAPLLIAFEAIKFVFGKLKDAITFVYPYVVEYLPVIGEYVGNFVKKFVNYISNMNAEEVMSWINTGALVSFAMSFKKVADAFSGIGEVFGAATEALENLGGVLKDYQKNLKANVLLKIAEAVGILAVSLIAISFVPADDLLKSVEAIGALFGVMVGSLALIMKALGGGEVKSLGDAVESFADIQMVKALGAFMLELSSAVGIMAVCIVALSQIGGDEMKTAMIGIGAIEALLGAIGLLMAKMPKSENNIMAMGIGLMFVALAVSKMADAVTTLIEPLKILGSMDMDTLKQGVIALAGMLAGMALAMALSSKAGLGSGVAMLAMVYALKEMAEIVIQFGGENADKLKQGLIMFEALAITLGLLAAVVGKSGFGASGGAGIALIAVSLEILVDVLTKFGELEHPIKSLGILAVVLVELSVAMALMNGASFGATALLLLAVALKILVPVLEAFGEMDHPIKAILMLAGVLGVLAVSAAIMAALAPGLLILSVALVALGAGMLAFSLALAAVAAIDIAALIALIPALGAAILELCLMIQAVTPAVMSTVGMIIEELCKLIIEKAPTVIETVLSVIDTFLAKLAEHMPSMIESIMSIVVSLLEGVRNHIGEIMYNVVDIVVEFFLGILTAVAERIGEFVQKAYEIVVGIIDGIADALGNEENAAKLREAIINLGKSIIEFFKNFFGIHSPSTVFQELGGFLIEGLIAGIGGLIGAAVDKIRELGEALVGKIQEKYEDFKAKGSELMGKIHEGIDSAKENVKQGFHAVIDGLKDFDINDFITSGKNILEGLKRGIEDSETFNKLKETTSNVFGAVKERIRQIFDEHSPSRVTHEYGRYVVEGFANGITDYAKVATNAASQFGEGTLDKINSIVNRVTELVENGINTEPTIRPIMDLTDVNTGMRDLGSMIDANTSMELATSANIGVNTMLERNQNGVVVNNNDVLRAIVDLKDNLTDMFVGNEAGLNINNNDVVSAILDLKDNISQMNSVLQNMNIVLDTGTLVGELSEPMDRSFGRMAVMNERGV